MGHRRAKLARKFLAARGYTFEDINTKPELKKLYKKMKKVAPGHRPK